MIGRTQWRFRSLPSTQDVAFQLAGLGAESGTVVRADFQSAGRGRLGRTWDVPANTALTFSIVLRPQVGVHQLGSLSIATAHMLSTVCAAAGARNVALKWPNDVLIEGRKVSGILVQTRMMPEPVAVIGIGINVNSPLESLPPNATSLAHECARPLDPETLFEHIVSSFALVWEGWQPTFTRKQIDDIDRLLWLRGDQVTLLDADREIRGTILGIGPDGGLRMMVGGLERTIYAGEITRGPRPIDDPTST